MEIEDIDKKKSIPEAASEPSPELIGATVEKETVAVDKEPMPTDEKSSSAVMATLSEDITESSMKHDET